MKYTSSNKPLVCMMTNSTCYKETKKMTIKGILWHSTGANNPNVKRYVQPSDNDANKDNLLKIIGKNSYKNDWNHKSVQAGLNAWIGKMADGSVRAVQTMPWDYRPWGCASGSKGSCNDGWIQWEMCEDGLTDATYFNAVYKEAVELTAYLCKMYNLDPKGTVTVNGVKVPVILCHADSHKLGFGSNHGDVYNWFNKHGKTMDNVRNDVAALLNADKPATPSTPSSGKFTKGDLVAIKQGATYYNGGDVPAWVCKKNWYLTEVSGDRAVVGKSEDGANNINSPVNTKFLTLVKSTTTTNESTTEEMYRVRITWEDSKTQKGAFKNLESAKVLADANAEAGYKVFNSAGKVVYTPTVKKPETPTVKEGKPYVVVTTINKYKNASDAAKKTNSAGTYEPGTYYIYDKYPDGSNGMFNISTDKTGSSAGGWINPSENVKQSVPVKEDPKPSEPTVDNNVPVYNNPTAIVKGYKVSANDVKAATVKFYKKIKAVNADFERAILDTFISQAAPYEIDPFIAVSQSILETGWFRFNGGSVKTEQHNYCGLGATGGGVSGASFDTIEQGVNAQYQHLYAYGCKDALPEDIEIFDPRYSLVTRGKAVYWEELAGKWAVPGYDKNTYGSIREASLAGATYGQKILKICEEVLSIEVTEDEIENYFNPAPVDPQPPTPVEPDEPVEPVTPDEPDTPVVEENGLVKFFKTLIKIIVDVIKTIFTRK